MQRPLSESSIAPGPRPTLVLPLHAGSDRVPSPVLVRGAVGAGQRGSDPLRTRAAEAVASAIGELVQQRAPGPNGPRWGEALPLTEGELMERTGLLHAEVVLGMDALAEAGTLGREEEGLRLDPDILGELPCVARLRWERVRAVLGGSGAALAPALAVLREIARLARPGDAGSTWVEGSLPALVESVSYGRTAVSTALSALGSAGLIERAPGRRLRTRITAAAFASPEPRAGAAPGGPSAAPSPAPSAAPSLAFGSYPLHLPAGTALALESSPDGSSRLHLGPVTIETAPDGGQTLRYGALRIEIRP
ncbi:MAG TPA: hypothetical protein VFL93_00925 [Longimicrobiaceae bacterium]|nr:hypothetical protein [Longimicrobiaceae bacterium]